MKRPSSYCSGCGHQPISLIVEEILQRGNGLLVSGVGCSVPFSGKIENVDSISAAHGRALSVATAARRVLDPSKFKEFNYKAIGLGPR